MNVEQDLRDEVMKWLPHDRADATLSAALAALRTDEIVGQFFNWLSRLIHPHPRQVLKSQAYIFRWVPSKEQVYLEGITEEIAAGADLNPRLSRGVIHGFVQGAPITSIKNLGRRRDLDLLLNEWGIHHLHLPDVLDSDGFVRRDPRLDRDLLLFAIFRDERAYLVDVLPHGEWTNESLVAVAVRNWPDAGLFLPLDVLGLAETINRSDRRKLRSVGVNAPIEIDGKVFISSTGGLTLAGTATQAIGRAHQLLHALHALEANIAENPEYLRPNVESLGHVYPSQPEFHVIFIRTGSWWGVAIREEVTGSVIPWRRLH